MNLLESLRRYTTVVADTGDIEAIAEHSRRTRPPIPRSCTRRPRCRGMSTCWRRPSSTPCSPGDRAARAPKRSWTSSWSTSAARSSRSSRAGCPPRSMPASASTPTEPWPRRAGSSACTRRRGRPGARPHQDRQHLGGIRAAEQLEREGIHCNLTLLFSFAQAVACAEAGVTLISPFVGRIYDWYKKERGGADIPADEDPGVASGHAYLQLLQEVRLQDPGDGASFRKVDQIVRLAGCDLLTISPDLLEQMEKTPGEVTRRLSVETARPRTRRRSTWTRRPSAGCTTRTRWRSRS